MTADAAFLRAIIAAPGDDLPRLIYADWLDERGDPRGEFIRVQIELAGITSHSPDSLSCEVARRSREDWCPSCARRHDLRRREQKLLRLHGNHWRERAGLNLEVFNDPDDIEYAFKVEFRRGFVESITCTWDDFARHADAIRAATPLREVRLTTLPEVVELTAESVRVYESPNIEATITRVFFLGGDRSQRTFVVTRKATDIMAVSIEEARNHLCNILYPGISFVMPPPTAVRFIGPTYAPLIEFGSRRRPVPNAGILTANQVRDVET